MKNSKTMHKNKKQSGFSIVELSIVLAIIAAAVAVILFSGSKMFGEAKKTAVLNDTAVAIPAAISICSSIHRGDLSSCNKDSLMRKAPTLETETACGDSWTIVASSTKVVLTYPLDSCESKDNIGNEVVEYVKELPRIDATNTSYTSSSSDLKITYLRK